MKSFVNKQWFKKCFLAFAIVLLASANLFAADESADTDNSLLIVLLIVIVGLMLAIGLLAYVVAGAAQVYVERFKEKQKEAAAAAKVTGIIALCFVTSAVFAADAPAGEAVQQAVITTIGGLSKAAFYMMLGIIALELIVLFTLLFQLKALLAKEQAAEAAKVAVAKEPVLKKIWDKMNSFKPEREVTDTGHDYDGIRELDNRLPPWWLYGFYACVVFAFVYLYRFHVSHTGPSTLQEYETEMVKAELEKEEYLKGAANKVDENTVTLLTDAAALGEGKKLYGASCSPCHGAEGQGVVGPNLTDDYWLHKGGVKDVFKTIKYGVPEKGMKSWKDDFSPVQLAQIASYIKSLNGSKPAGAKEPQGELYKEEAQATADSASANKKLALN